MPDFIPDWMMAQPFSAGTPGPVPGSSLYEGETPDQLRARLAARARQPRRPAGAPGPGLAGFDPFTPTEGFLEVGGRDPLRADLELSYNAPTGGTLGALAKRPPAPEAGEAPKTFFDLITPEQQAAMAGRFVTMGGSPGGIARSTSTKYTPQMPGIRDQIEQIRQQQVRGLIQQADAEIDQSKREALAIGGHATALKQRDTAVQSRQEAIYAQIKAEESRLDQARADYAQMEPNPERWWSSGSAWQKAGSLLAVALGGIGQVFMAKAGRDPGPNAALQMINATIDREIETQKMALAKKQGEIATSRGALGDLYQRLGSIPQAEAQARSLLADSLSTRLKHAAALTADESIRGKMLQAASAIDNQSLIQRQQSYAGEAGEQTVLERRTPGTPGQKVSLLELAAKGALQQQQLKTALTKSRAEQAKAEKEMTPEAEKAPAKLDKADLAPIQATFKARGALDLLDVAARDAAKTYGQAAVSPRFLNSQQRLRAAKDLAIREAAKALGAEDAKKLFQETIMTGWDSQADLRSKMEILHRALGNAAEVELQTLAPIRDVSPWAKQELQLRKRANARYRWGLEVR